MQENTTKPSLDHLFESQIQGTDYLDVRFKPSGSVFFGIHHYNEPEDPTNAGYFIREEIGIARAILPKDFQKKGFESMQKAKAYCLSHFYSLLNLCHEARN